jgi:hypothetical protein
MAVCPLPVEVKVLIVGAKMVIVERIKAPIAETKVVIAVIVALTAVVLVRRAALILPADQLETLWKI